MKKSTQTIGFDWDRGNKDKNWEKHQVSDEECEEVFFDSNKKILKDPPHSAAEARYVLLGQTKSKRLLFVVSTLKRNKIRVISARVLNKKEKHLYEQKP